MAGLRERLAAAVERVSDPFDAEEPDPETYSRSGSTFVTGGRPASVERINPPKNELQRYRRQYESVPIVQAPIDQFANDVMSDGYRIKADNESTEDYLDQWAEHGGIVASKANQDLGKIIARIPIEYHVRGTVMLEHVSAQSDADMMAALKFIKPETVTPYKRPNGSIVVQPDDTDLEDVKTTEDGDAAAYVQYDRSTGSGTTYNSDEVRLTANEVSRLSRHADIGGIFGLSSVEPVSNRVDALRNKLVDNEQAIESMAWGQWFLSFQPLVVDDRVIEWDENAKNDAIDDFQDIEPGAQIGHDGKIEVESIPGQVADIMDNLQFDVDFIISALPAPKYAVGWEKDINQFVSDSQERTHEQQVDDMKETIETLLTPVLKTVARQGGYSAEGVELKLSPPEDSSPILTLDAEEIDGIKTYAEAMKALSGPAGPASLVEDGEILDLVLQLPDDVGTPDDMGMMGQFPGTDPEDNPFGPGPEDMNGDLDQEDDDQDDQEAEV